MAYRWINCLLAVAFLFLPAAYAGEKKGTSLEELEKKSPGLIQTLLEEIDLSRPDLKQVSDLYQKKEIIQAGYALLDYYRKSAHRFPWLTSSMYRGDPQIQILSANQAMRNSFTFQGITATPQTLPSGLIDWNDLGPKHDKEWGWMLNRHLWFLDYVGCWATSPKSEYAQAFDRQISDWLLSNKTPPFWNPTNSPTWRPLEVARRLYESWPPAFYAFQNAPEFSPATRIRMLHSIHTQAEYCRQNLSTKGNHLNTESIGLASAATCWPEFKKSKQWLDFAVTQMKDELSKRVYPDGSQMELSNHYQIVVATHCQTLANYLNWAHHPQAEEFNKMANKLWSYTYQTTKPDGNGLLNNDCEFENNAGQIAMNKNRALLMQNKNGINTIPTDLSKLKSIYFPWAGQAIMRGNKGKESDFSFFDMGPLGTAHQHYDTLNFTLFSGGRDILVDAGRYIYKPGKWRRYFTGQPAHNVILFDGGGENEDPRQTRTPIDAHWISTPEFDFASGNTTIRLDSLIGTSRIKHTRSVLYVRDQYWLVIDEITGADSHKIEIPWHFAPDCTVEIKDKNIVETSDKNKGNLRIIPLILNHKNLDWEVSLIKGQTSPTIQGWYSPHYNIKIPSPTAVYTLKRNPPTLDNRPLTFIWLLVPGKKPPQDFQITEVKSPKLTEPHLEISQPNGTRDTIILQSEKKNPLLYSNSKKNLKVP